MPATDGAVPDATPKAGPATGAHVALEPGESARALEPGKEEGPGTPLGTPAVQPAPPSSPRRPTWWDRIASPTITGVVVAVLAGVVAAGATGAAELSRPAIYDSQVALLIDQPREIVSAGSDGIVAKLNALRLKYLTLIRTSLFTGPVAAKLGLPPGEVASSVEANVLGASLVMIVGARNHVPESAQKIAQAVAEQMVSYVVSEGARASIPVADRITVQIVVPASPAVKVEPTRRRALTFGAVSGGIALVAFYVLVQLIVVRRKT